jgi:hypothetical protein
MTRQQVVEKVAKYLAAMDVTVARDGQRVDPELFATVTSACTKLVARYADATSAKARAVEKKNTRAKRAAATKRA